MFYDAVSNAHGLARDPFKALVAPRPIGWISTVDTAGAVNLALPMNVIPDSKAKTVPGLNIAVMASDAYMAASALSVTQVLPVGK